MTTTRSIVPFALLILSGIVFYISKDFILFWDTIQFAGHHPLFYFETGFDQLILPNEIDSGHVPLFGVYIALWWSLLDKALWTSHLAMLPFVFFCLWNAYRLGKIWTSDRYALSFPLLLLCLPQSMSQFLLVSPDVVLLAAFLGLILSFEKEQFSESMAWATLLPLISNRGVMIIAIIVIWRFVFQKKRSLKDYWLFLPGIILFSIFQLLHFIHTGWIGHHDDMPWSSSFEGAGLMVVLKNAAMYIWRLLDFGAIMIWMFLLNFIWLSPQRFKESHMRLLVLLCVILGGVTITYSGLLQHRYFLPSIVLAGFIVLKWIYENGEYIKPTLIGVLMSLVIGNTWIYPDKIAQGWDSTVAHTSFYSLQSEAIEFIEDNEIPFSEVATAFPLRSSLSTLYLNQDIRRFKDKDSADTPYILYSNIMNDFSDEEIDLLKMEWTEVQTWKKRRVTMTLYSRE